MLARANNVLGTNWTMHDLRLTAAVRMSRDKTLSARDIQTILGHAHLSTTTDICLVEDFDETIARVRHHLDNREKTLKAEEVSVATGYDADALEVLQGSSVTAPLLPDLESVSAGPTQRARPIPVRASRGTC
ncbi:hypothetical protein [Prescottella equi]|uniref:hypothetical protein n=1 Tax=Rhodococcus hoagii TaxID=43767 RepID=UPI00301BB2D8